MNRELVKRIIRYGWEDDPNALAAAVRQLAESEVRQGHKTFAAELRAIIETHRKPRQALTRVENGASSLPRSKTEAAALVDVRWSRRTLNDIILEQRTRTRVLRVLEENAKAEHLKAHGLQPKRKLLFFGKPGNGKTLCAEVLAGELELPLFYVRFDALVGSYLGETAANLRKVFDFGAAERGVLFFDECDAIAKTRDSKDDVGELKRVVNSFLQLLDGYAGGGPVIAATNYEKLLDHALARRFDDLIGFPSPGRSQLVAFFEKRLAPFRRDFSAEDAAGWCEGFSFSDADRVFTDSLKTMILGQESRLRTEVLCSTLAHYRSASDQYTAEASR